MIWLVRSSISTHLTRLGHSLWGYGLPLGFLKTKTGYSTAVDVLGVAPIAPVCLRILGADKISKLNPLYHQYGEACGWRREGFHCPCSGFDSGRPRASVTTEHRVSIRLGRAPHSPGFVPGGANGVLLSSDYSDCLGAGFSHFTRWRDCCFFSMEKTPATAAWSLQ